MTTNGNKIEVNWTENGNHTISVNATNSCGDSPLTNLKVTVDSGPNFAGKISGPNKSCVGSENTYSTASVEGISYSWILKSGGTISGSGSSIKILWSKTGKHELELTPSNKCKKFATIKIIVEISKGVPTEKPIISGIGNILTSSVEDGNQWYYNGNAIPDATEQTYVAFFIEFDYTVSVTSACGTSISDPYNILVSGLDEISLVELDIDVYPNPSGTGRFEFDWDNIDHVINHIKVIDISGKTVFEQKNINYGFIMNLSDQRKGLYNMIIESEKHVIRKKLIIR